MNVRPNEKEVIRGNAKKSEMGEKIVGNVTKWECNNSRKVVRPQLKGAMNERWRTDCAEESKAKPD